MNQNLIFRTLGLILLCEALGMAPSLLVAFFLNENCTLAFFLAMIITVLPGLFFVACFPANSEQVSYKEGFVIATLGWLILAVFGSLPFIFSGAIGAPVDAFFEAMSGFTTTGASVLANVEVLPHSILLWRSFTQWLGGMGVIVLTVALIPSLRVAGLQLFRAEVPGPTKSKLVPRVAVTARMLYRTYSLITAVEIVLLKLAGMSWFDSIVHAFSTVSTGGFSSRNLSVGAYGSAAIEFIIIFFMVVCGANFVLHFQAFRGGGLRAYREDPEFKFYLRVIILSVFLIVFNLVWGAGYKLEKAFQAALFQVSSIITTTGFSTADFNQWPPFSQIILVILMFLGGCAGSTSGAIKQVRILTLIKSVSRQFTRLLHPQAVIPLRLKDHPLSEEVVEAVQVFFFIYIFIFCCLTIFLASLGMDLISAASAGATALGNVGPGLGLVGPASNFASLSAVAKVVLSISMLIGRLELYTVIVLFSVRFWKM